jgi:hypothetical protein
MNRRNVWVAIQDDVTAAKLVQIVSQHVSLVLEHGQRGNYFPTEGKRLEGELISLKRNGTLF